MTDNTQPEAREFTMSQYASKDDMIGAMRKRIAELESELEAVGAGGVNGPPMGRASLSANAGEPTQDAFQRALSIRTAQGWTLRGGKVPVLYTDEINGEQVCRYDVWLCTTAALAAPPTAQAEGWTATAQHQTYRCKIKSRKQIDKEIPRDQQGWWADVAAGQKLLLRPAVQADIDRCHLGGRRSKNPDDYMCETQTNGSLVSKIALEYMHPEQNVFAAVPLPPTSAEGVEHG